MPPKKRKLPEIARINIKDLEEVSLLGRGGFGSVYHMKWKKDHEKELDVAAKQLLHNQEDILEQELGFLSSLEHPNIVKLLGYVPEDFNCMLILELCHGGSLRTYLSDRRNTLEAVWRRTWAEQAARAIEYLQCMEIIHKDIKSDNFLITLNGILKLADFGLAKRTNKTLNNVTDRGTVHYQAPEIFKQDRLSFKSDIFAFGVVLWELVTREIPFEGQGRNHIIFKVCDGKRLPIPADCPENLAKLMRWCWLENYHKRPEISAILSLLKEKSSDSILPNSLGIWDLQHQRIRGPIASAHGVAICSKTNDLEIAIITERVKIYSASKKNFLITQIIPFSDRDISTQPYAIAVSCDGTYFVTDHTNHLSKIRESAMGRFDRRKIKIEISDKMSPNPNPTIALAGIAIDNSSHLLIGIHVEEESYYICSYYQEEIAQPQMCFKIPIKPEYLAVTSTNAIVISSPQAAEVQVYNHKGRYISSLNPPDEVTDWSPHGVCCTEGMILVANDAVSQKDTGIYSYSISYKYLGCIIVEVSCPRGMAVTEDDATLIVGNSEVVAGVKVFKRTDVTRDVTERSITEHKPVHHPVREILDERVFCRKFDYRSEENGNSSTTQSTITVRQNDLVTLTPSTSTTVTDTSNYTYDNDDGEDDEEVDTLDLSVPETEMSQAAGDSARISTNKVAFRMSQETVSEGDAANPTFTGGSEKNLSDNYAWLDHFN